MIPQIEIWFVEHDGYSSTMQLSSAVQDMLLTHSWPVVVAVSGWPDSMCVMTLIRNFYVEYWCSLTDLHVAHYHHGLRLESDDERDLVLKTFVDCTVHIWYYEWWSTSERDLRIARHEFFASVMDEVVSTILITGHNLTDRIETSLLNMKRWCQIKWMINMTTIETKNRRKRGEKEVKSFSTLRPLLSYPKAKIQAYCDDHHIPYMTDNSNMDPSVSRRNQIRQEIVTKLDHHQLQNRQDLYARLESSQTHYIDPLRDEQQWWCDCGAVGEWSLEYLAWLFDWSGCYADMTQGRLLEWQQRIATSYQGEKFVGWWRWWIKYKKVWIFKV